MHVFRAHFYRALSDEDEDPDEDEEYLILTSCIRFIL